MNIGNERYDLMYIICSLARGTDLCDAQVKKAIDFYDLNLQSCKNLTSDDVFVTSCTHYSALMTLHKNYNYQINTAYITKKFSTYVPQTTDVTWLLHYMFINECFSEQEIRKHIRLLFKKSRIYDSEWHEIVNDVLYFQSAPESVLLEIFESEYQRKKLVIGH